MASFDSDYGPDYWPLYHSDGASDLDVWHNARELLVEHHPSLFLLYLERVDHFGHSGSWTYYTRAVQIADSIVGLVWDFIESDDYYAGKTTLIVTNDHGRHTEDWTGHGCDCAGCRTVMMLALGPDIKSGFVSEEPRTIRDITPTIGELLGFETPKATGSPMMEILVEPD
jgi:bisphosphoglycerate-independent phosphoglycerate mutase (AlkP superfamily)